MQPTFKLVPLEPWHLTAIDIQEKQRYFSAKCADPAFRVALAQAGGVTGLVDYSEGKAPLIVGIAGILPYEDGVGMGWSVLSTSFPKYATRATREIKRYCKEKLATTYHRIEIQTDADFEQANRWAKMLGFEFESVRRQGSPYRQDMNVYVMIREEE